MSTTMQNLRRCTCSRCKTGVNGFKLVNRKTLVNHEEADERASFLMERMQQTNENAATETADVPEHAEINANEESDDEDVLDDIFDDEEEDEEEAPAEDLFARFGNNEYLPTEPLAFVLFLTLFLLNGKHLTEEACEILMIMFNIALEITHHRYRFPVRAETFVAWCQLASRVHHGMKEYVSCTICHAVHPFETACEKIALLGKTCSSVEPFPRSTRCGNDLFLANAKNELKPKRSFFYNSIITTLKTFFLREDFVDDVKHWQSREVIPGVMSDVYDGSIWREFKMNPADEVPYVQQSSFNLMLTINVDWFQLYTNSVYSCGGIYLTIQNLPREIRNLRKNVLLCALLPGPGEPKTFQMNHYLRLLVDELLLLADCVQMQTKYHSIVTIKAALTMVACDLPAARKVIGMTSHNSINACNQCTHLFKSIPGHPHQRNFAAAPRDGTLVTRDAASHRVDAEIWKNTATASGRTELEQKNGVRYNREHEYSNKSLVLLDTYLSDHATVTVVTKQGYSHIRANKDLSMLIPFVI
ncbi:hypothetical protein INT47_012014 [Mucor saturninus]|uniref:Transposase n=1 Tax=Mucor saturninus TaxID=64648 RepID=A0A8H7QDT5_9FUNG|nr:hypothetical protein INT47_012014 [Mucor saturninus]